MSDQSVEEKWNELTFNTPFTISTIADLTAHLHFQTGKKYLIRIETSEVDTCGFQYFISLKNSRSMTIDLVFTDMDTVNKIVRLGLERKLLS